MKNQFNSRREQAVALIIVLAMLVLLSGLIVAFMNSVGNERAASVVNSNGLSSRQLADSTVNLVISQIRQATTQASVDAKVPTTWASQPGAIRTLSGTVGSPVNIANGVGGVTQFTYKPDSNDWIFKLYSADKMKIPASDISGKAWDTTETQFIENWKRIDTDPKSKQNNYVDLNEPVLSPLPSSVTNNNPKVVEPRYPIIDPRARMSATETAVTPQTDPGIVDGFDIKTTNLTDSTLKFISKNATGGTVGNQPVPYLPMPVKWLYVMRDGSMAAADDNSGKIIGASAQNPIIGRTAFWTDDDTCKLNINTASEGTFWDTPSVSCEQESGNSDTSKVLSAPGSAYTLALAASQPARFEFQRYPGHPATTCLSPVLGWMWGILPKDAPRATRDVTLLTMKDAINSMAPFSPYSYPKPAANLPPITAPSPIPPNGTSMGGAYNTDREVVYKQVPDPIAKKDRPVAQAPQMAVATKHLYASVDEYIFKSDRAPVSTANPPPATPLNGPASTTKLNPDALEKVRFFLTANSRSPELNLFGRPRVTFWPVNASEGQRTNFDDLFAFTSTLYKDPAGNRANDNIFYFTRYDAKNRWNDFHNSLPNEPPNKNERMFSYLQLMTGDGPFNRIPGFGGSFRAKHPDANGFSERDQILTEIFDYCRTVNLVDTSSRTRDGSAFKSYTPFFGGTLGGTYPDRAERSFDWSGQVTPGRTSNPDSKDGYQGLGRFPMICEAAIVFHRSGPPPAAPPAPQDLTYQATLLFEMATVMPGYPSIRETCWMRVRVDTPTLVEKAKGVNGAPPAAGDSFNDIELVGSPGQARRNVVNVPAHDATDGRGFMPTLGFLNQMCYYTEPSGWTDITDPARPLPLFPANPIKKKFQWENLTDSTKDSTVDGNKYLRPNKSITFYPYVSRSFTLKPGDPLRFKGGAFTVEIFAGEAPDDDRAPGQNTVPVQTVHLVFPPDILAFTAPTGGDASFNVRGWSAQSDGGWDILQSTDIIRSIEFVGPAATLNQQGDLRLGMCKREIPAAWYQPRNPGTGTDQYKSTALQVHGLSVGHGDPYLGYKPTVATDSGVLAKGGTNRESSSPPKRAILPAKINGVQNTLGGAGDYDRGISKHEDGAFGNKVDEGNTDFDYSVGNGNATPYFRGRAIAETGQSFFSPNRQLSSAVMFGSLPTGVVRERPWQTLLFRPDRGLTSHPGAQTASNPADHLLLDLFNLPIVEPYAISEAFSSGGKVNLNYVIAPFGYAKGDIGFRSADIKMPRSYLRRDTALRGVLKAVKVMAVPTGEPNAAHAEAPLSVSNLFRFDIDAERTLDQFENRLKDPNRGLFRSASEICDMDLYPVVPNGGNAKLKPSNWGTFWDTDFAQTGDNMRERPYSHIYPRVTTKSNTYTIHMRCQALKKAVGTPPDQFDPKLDKVLGEYRGSATIERFVDPNDAALKDYKATDAQSSVDPFYRFRVVSTKQFLPR